ncbi:MAG: TlpA disulfide reductase family protein [Candidatus Acidiferrales bacterium]
MRFWLLLGALCLVANANGRPSASDLWNELKTKREAQPGFHQEFEATRTFVTTHVTQGSQTEIVVDFSQKKWREHSVNGSEDRIRIFDGQDLFLLEPEGDEYVRTKHKAKEDDPEPGPYGSTELDWAKAKEITRQPCGFSGDDHSCVVFEAPVKKQARMGIGGQITRISNGIARLVIDSETGMLVQMKTREVIDNGRMIYTMDLNYSLTRMRYGTVLDPGLFQLPKSAMHEVKQLSLWNVSRIKKQLLGKPAPKLEVTDLQGNPVSLPALKGKTVLLDFWTTWCPPCRADAPSLDKLYAKYGGKDLVIIGISVDEERAVVEKFLKEHPHSFPVVLTSENEMPRPYQVGAFPTYMVIAADGTVASAAEGDQGFGELRKFLKKAGMDTD